ncbi:MAG: radical SAM protein, partial [Candidatus Woesearchaeota archaeon]
TLNFSFGKSEKEYICDTVKIIEKVFAIEPKIVYDKTSTRVSVNNNVLGNLFEKLFCSGSRNKRIHPLILGLPQDRLKQLLCGYIRGDGDKNLICSTVSRSLAYQIQLIGFKCGYSPGVYRCKGNDSVIEGRTIKCNGHYAVSFKNTQRENELKEIVFGIKQTKKQNSERYLRYKNCILLPIRELKHFTSKKRVFNIEVSSQHNYTVNNIVVKNCSNHLYRQLYCSHGKLLRRYSVDYVIKELKRLKQRFNSVGVFDIRDETLLARPLEEIKDFSERYKKEVGIRFKCLADPPTVHEEKLKHLIDAGLTDIIIGIQSGSDRVNLEVYKRYIKRGQVLKAAKILNKFKGKLAVMYDMITTNPYEEKEDVLDSISICIEIPKPYFLSVNNLVFFLGTPLYEQAIKDGIIKNKEDSAFDLNYWDRWKHIKLKKKNAYLNLVLNLMRGPVTEKRYGLLPASVLKFLIKPKVVDFNLKHTSPTYLVGSCVQVMDYFRENVAKPLYRSLPTGFKVWYDKVRYKV